ncbi:MAG: peptide ABC transporter substrate-binding protein, partial [Candidatus Methylomirabilales bacterium]
MRTRKGLALPALLVSIALVASACRKVERPREPLTKGLFRVEEGEPGSLDPPHADDSTEIVVVKNIFEGLVTYDDKTAAVGPGMATKWEQNPEATQFTFTLRRDATFSNGEPVTAESFVRGWTRATAREEDAELAYHLSGIKGYKEHHDAGTAANLEGVVAKDRFTLEVTLSGPDPEFVIKSGHVAFMPVPKQQTIRAQNPSWGEFPIGNGPFMLKGPEPWKHNQSITMVPNAKYRGGRPRPSLSEVRFVVFQDLETAYAEWQAGNLDWTHVPPGKLKEAEEKNPGNFLKRTSAGLTYLDTITDKAPTNNKLFRQAISLAVDREAINQAIFNGLQQPADSIIPPRMPGYRQGACKFCTYDPARAKQLFKDSKVRIRGKLAIYLNAGAGHEEWMQAVGAQIKTNLGIDYQVATKGPPFS